MTHDVFCGRTRREFLWETGAGFTGLGLTGLLAADGFFATRPRPPGRAFVNPMAPKPPHFAAKAKSVIFLFMYGGPSHVDTFDYKPKLYPLDGKTIPVKTFGRGGHKNAGPRRRPEVEVQAVRPVRQVGLATCSRTSARCVDDIAFVHSMYAESPIHGSAMLMMNSGRILSGNPEPRLVGDLRPGQREREPARLRRHARQDRRADQRRQELVERLHAGRVSGHRRPARRHADPRPGTARRA